MSRADDQGGHDEGGERASAQAPTDHCRRGVVGGHSRCYEHRSGAGRRSRFEIHRVVGGSRDEIHRVVVGGSRYEIRSGRNSARNSQIRHGWVAGAGALGADVDARVATAKPDAATAPPTTATVPPTTATAPSTAPPTNATAPSTAPPTNATAPSTAPPTNATAPSTPTARAQVTTDVRHPTGRALAARALVTCLLAALVACGQDAPDPAPTVATAEPIRGAFVITREDHETPVRGDTRVEESASVATAADARGALRLDGGGWVLLGRDTEATLTLDALTLNRGRVWVDARHAPVRIQTDAGVLTAEGATFAVEVTDGTHVYCGAGELTWEAGGADGLLQQGEELALGSGDPRPARLWDDWTGGLADPTPAEEAVAGYVGVLAGRRLDEIGKARRPLSLRAHEVDAAIEGDFATTTVVQTFFNAESADLETDYRLRLPTGAIVQSFAVDLGGGLVEGEVVPMASDGYSIRWHDPGMSTSRLAYDGPDRLHARIHPVPAGGTVRVKLVYSEWLRREGDRRTYVYPMATDDAVPPLVGELRIGVDAFGANAGAYRAGMGARVEDGNVVLRRSDHRPTADFYLDLIDPEDGGPPEGALAYVVEAQDASAGVRAEGDERFVLFDLPLEEDDDEVDDGTAAAPLELVIVVDVSGATAPEDLELARATLDAVLRQLSPADRVTLRVGDVHARVPDGASAELASATEGEALLEALAAVPLGGATDLGAVLREAAAVVAGRPRGALLYVGDGTPTTGSLDATSIRRTLAGIDGAPRFFGLAVGEGANLDLLRALFGERGARRVHERTEASRAVMRILADAARPMLRDVEVDLGAGVERVFPRGRLVTPRRGRLRLIGRLAEDAELPGKLTLSGRRDGEAFEREVNVVRRTVDDQGDIRRRWASHRLQELLDADAGREALVELGVRFGVITPWTSMLVMGGKVDGMYLPIRGFDDDPFSVDYAAGGGAPMPTERGWRRRRPSSAEEAPMLAERTWNERVVDVADSVRLEGDGGLGRAAVTRALATGTRGPDGCYERRLLVRPDLSGMVSVSVEVDGDGSVKDATLQRSTLGAADVDACILTEIRGIRFPATGGGSVSVSHTYRFTAPSRGIGVRRTCSDASRQSLEIRRNLWRERLAANGGVSGAISVWQDAQRACELSSWRARRTLLAQMLRHVGGVPGQVNLYQRLRGNAAVASYLRRRILANVRSARDLQAVQLGLGLDAPVDWRVFSRLWKRAGSPAAKLALVRRWLEVLPDEMDLRLKLLALLEETGALPEARRLARALRDDPLADARVLTEVGEFWLRQGDEQETRRVFSDLVEQAPYDPWARRRLGDLYRAHEWFDDAYREYQSLARLRPDEPGVWLLLARAAAGAGRIDEALRLEQRLSERAEEGALEGVAGVARSWSTARLAALKQAETVDAAALARRERRSGILRDPPAALVILTWPHPDDAPLLKLRRPTTDEEAEDDRHELAELQGSTYGLQASVMQDPEVGPVRIRVERPERDRLRDLEATLTVITDLGTPQERITIRELELTRSEPVVSFVLEDGALR